MKTNRFGEIVHEESDIIDLVMQGRDPVRIKNLTVDTTVDIETLVQLIENPQDLMTWSFPESSDIAVPEFDHIRQNRWFMPDEYKNIDIAEYVLSLCSTQEELQRAGEELLLFQQYDLFDLLRYLRYLVDVMRQNRVIWGVGRGSSVASFVLYLLGVHRINSLHYDLNPREFLR
jgi:DNA polymerase III alpha subunit